jgi:zinc transporter 10
MLLKAGMTIKQAIFYNVLSSVLAFLGMVVGLSLGNLEHFSSWMFAATAGIFLYVALVDMMPELSSGHAHPISRSAPQSQASTSACQLAGMLVTNFHDHMCNTHRYTWLYCKIHDSRL